MLERFNDWCGEFLNRMLRYDDMITFCMMSLLFVIAIICVTVCILGMLGFFR